MKTRRLPIAAAITAALALCSAPASSAALGEILSISTLGEPFRAEIGIAAGTLDDAANCLRVVAPGDGAAELPWLKSGRISVSGRGSGTRIVVTSPQPVNEPALKLVIADVCGTHMHKEYTLLLPYPVAAAPAAVVAPRRSEGQAASPGGRATTTRTWTTAPGESLASLAEALYPDDGAARRRFVSATAQANPALFPDAASRSSTLEPGTRVLIPDLRRAAAPRRTPGPAGELRVEQKPPAPKASRGPAPLAASAAPPVVKPSGAGTDRLIVADDMPRTGSAPGVVASGGLSPNTKEVDASWSVRERELAAAVDRSIIAEMELLARIKELEQIQARLQQQTQALIANMPATAAPAVQTAPLTASQPPAGQAPAAPATAQTHKDWYLAAALLLGILLILAGLLRRRSGGVSDIARRQPVVARPHVPKAPAAPASFAATPATLATPAADGTSSTRADAPIAWDAGSRLPDTAKIVMTEAGGESVEEHKSAIELAEIMMSFGRVQGAADTLAEFIQGNPKQAITPWLKLLDVYKAAGLRAEFDGLAYQLNKTFNVRAVSWDTYDSVRAIPLSLENLPHIVSRLQAQWRTRECQAFIQQLLRDNRDGAREGFPFPVIDELLLLEAILDDELGTYRSYVTKLTEAAG